MPTFKGNRGNLLQHWVLVEVASLLQRVAPEPSSLCFVDAHAMSPWAVRHVNPGQTAFEFERVRDGLPGQASAYELAWHALVGAGEDRYPSSAAFLRHTWRGSLHLLLCEHDESAAQEISKWLETLSPETSHELHRGDWRTRFESGLPREYTNYLISFDPYMFDRHGPALAPNVGNMWPADIIRLCTPLIELPASRIVVQLSTYSANNGNPQAAVIETITPIFEAAGFRLDAKVRADGSMMSLVFSRGLSTPSPFATLEEQFSRWLDQAR